METNIHGLNIFPLKKISTPKGEVRHYIRSTDPFFTKFGEVYFSITSVNEIKGWKFHKELTQLFTVQVGAVRFVFYDHREKSPTKGQFFEIEISQDNYQLIQVPPQLWYSFKTTSEVDSMIVNCTDIQHKPDECINIPLEDPTIPYQWK